MPEPSAPLEPSSQNAKAANDEPVWHRPAWITAIVGVISAFLTIPEVVSDYLSKQQEIEAAIIDVEKSKQAKEFEVVQNTLSQQGDERIFMLRYFAATLDDPEAKTWAQGEVDRLDELTRLEGELDRQRRQIEAKEAEIERLQEAGGQTEQVRAELMALRAQNEGRDLEVAELRRRAGIDGAARPSTLLHWHLSTGSADPQAGPAIIVRSRQWLVRCIPDAGRPCQGTARAIEGTIIIEGAPPPMELTGTLITVPADPNEQVAVSQNFALDCSEITDRGSGHLFWQCNVPRDVAAPRAREMSPQMQLQMQLPSAQP